MQEQAPHSSATAPPSQEGENSGVCLT